MRKIINSTRGVAAVEFAIIAPLLLVLVFGIIEFAVVLYNQAVITNASREAARFAATFYTNPAQPADNTHPTCDNVQDYTAEYVNAHLIAFKGSTAFLKSNVSCPGPGGTPSHDYSSVNPYAGHVDIIRIQYDYGFLVFGNLIGLLAPGTPLSSITLGAQTAMLDQNQTNNP